MADGKVIIEIDGDDSGFAGKLDSVDKSASHLAGSALKALGKATAAASAAFTASAAAAVAAGSAYETAFAKTATIMDTTLVSADAMSEAIIDLSNETGTAATELSNSVYDAISATGDTANAVKLVADASKLATAGFAEEADALSVLTTITNAYGLEASQAKEISDSLIQTQNLGVTTVGQLASSMGKAIATASAYSVDLYNLESAYVSLTKAGISTEESTTYLSSMFNELGDAGSDVAAVITDKTGKSFGQLMKSGASLGDVLDILMDSVNGDTEALMNLWGSAEAGKAASAIASQGIKSFNGNLLELKNSAGTTEAAYETMTKTLSYQTDKLQTRITNLGTAVYDYFDDGLTEGVSALSDAFLELSDSITDGELADEMENIGSAVTGLITKGVELASDVLPDLIDGASWVIDHGDSIATGVGTIAGAYLAYEVAATAATIATTGLNSVFSISPIGAVAASVVGAVGVFSLLANEINRVTPEVQALNEANEQTANTTQSVVTALTELEAAYQKTKTEIIESKENNDAMITSLMNMVAAYDGTSGAAALIQATIDSINASIPNLNLAFDEETGAINRTTDALYAMNEEYAAYEEYSAALSEKASAEEAVRTARENLTDATARLTEAQRQYNEYVEMYGTVGELAAAGDAVRAGRAADLKQAVDDATAAQEAEYDAVNDALGAYSNASKEVERTSEAYADAADASAEYAETTEETTESIEDQTDATDEATKSIAKIGLEAYDAVESGGNLRDAYDALREEMDKLSGTGDAYVEALAEQNLIMLDVAATTQELSAEYGNMSNLIGVSSSEIAGYLVMADLSFEDFAASVESATDSIVNGFSVMDTSLDMSLSEMAEALQANITATAEWNTNIATLWNAAVASGKSGATEFVQQLYEMGPSAATQVAQMVTDVGATLDTFAPLFANAGQAGVEQAALGASIAAGVAYDSGLAVGGEIATGVTDADTESAGEDAGEDVAAGVDSTEDDVSESAEGLVEAVTCTWDDASDDFKSSGSDAASLIASGITAKTSVVSDASLTAGSAAYIAFRDITWSNLGYYISSGIASGITSGSGLITSAAKSAAWNAYLSAKETLDINSPSKLFWDNIGYQIPAGIAGGVTEATPLAEDAVEVSAEQLYDAAQIALHPSTILSGNQYQYITNNTSTAIRGSGSAVTRIVVPLTIDGREFARATAEYSSEQMDFMEV